MTRAEPLRERRERNFCHPDEASNASGWKDLGQRGVSAAGSGFVIAQRSFAAGVADDARDLSPSPSPFWRGEPGAEGRGFRLPRIHLRRAVRNLSA
jgi:hypothetical protein